jgi:RNA polymerase sigma-70 factor (ECF subfamily)
MELAKANQGAMLRLAMRLWEGDRNSAEETAQETIVTAFKSVRSGQFSDFDNFRPWILKVVLNVFRLEIRQRRRFVPFDTASQYIEDSIAASQPMFESDFDPLLRAALDSLSTEQKMCVLLVDIDGLDYAEAAMIMTVPIGTIRSRLARARLNLAKYVASLPNGDFAKYGTR